MAAKGITNEEAFDAWNNWVDYFHEQGTWGGFACEKTGYDQFQRFIGENIFRKDKTLGYEAIRKVKLLSSTHWRTVMKVIEINETELRNL